MTRREDRVVELLLALRDSQGVSLRVPSGHHVEVGARRPPILSERSRSAIAPRTSQHDPRAYRIVAGIGLQGSGIDSERLTSHTPLQARPYSFSSLSMAFTTLPDQSLQWLLGLGVTIHYQPSLTQDQVTIRFCGPPSFFICPIFDIACAGEVLSQPPIYLQSPLRANPDVKYESPQWLRFAGDSNSSIFHVGETMYFRKLVNAPGRYLRP